MPSVNRENDAPKHLRPYLCHGVELSYRAHSDQAEGECFVCGKSKLYVNCNDGLADCKSCDAKGNIYTFLLKHLHAQSLQNTPEKDYQALAEERKLLHSDTLYQWGVCKSSITGEWLIPSYNANGRLNNLYRWVLREDKKRELRSTAELHPGLMGVHLFDDKKSQVMLCYSEDTEVLTESGWKLFGDLTDFDKLAAYEKGTGCIEFETPRARQKYHFSGEMINFRSKWCDLLVTPDHRMLCSRRLHHHNCKVKLAKDIGPNEYLPVSGFSHCGAGGPNQDEVRLLVAFAADGHIDGRGFKIRFTMKKERKKARLRELLAKVKIPFEERITSFNPSYTTFYLDRRTASMLLKYCPNKTWTEEVFSWSMNTRRTLLQELQHWDGDCQYKSIRYFTSKPTEADIISRLAIQSGYCSQVRVKQSRDANRKNEHIVSISDKRWRVLSAAPVKLSYTGSVYCATVSTGFLVVRRNGKALVSGNCEGAWDGMALWEVLGGLKAGSQGGYARTSKEADSYLADISVLAVPSCNGFDVKWGELLANKDVTFFFDSDHPRRLCPKCKRSYSVVSSPESCPTCKVKWTKKQTVITPVGFQGTQRACQILAGCPEVPKTVHYLRWGTDEEPGYDAERPSGYDVRDALTEGEEATTKIMARGENLSRIMDRVVPIPAEWVAQGAGVKEGTLTLPTKPCKEWKVLRTAFVKAMQWTPGYEAGLACMLAAITSVRFGESQLWFLLQSPPGSGKTVLCNALATCRKWVYCVDKIKGVHSGYKADKSGKQDFGLIPKIRDKTLIMKDGDTFLNIPNLENVMADLRTLYDTNTSSHYLQGAGREYLNTRSTVIIAGTDSLHRLDDSELGQRFLIVSLMEGIDADMEEDICMKAMYRLDTIKGFESNGKPEDQDTREMTEAKQLCGGYVEHLRKHAQQLLDELEPIDEATTKQIFHMGKFVAHMRARPSRKQTESQRREMATRLCLQLRKLAYCLAVVFNKKRIDSQVMGIVHKVTMDSSRGRSLAICRALRKYPEEGLEVRSISSITGQSKEKERDHCRFLKVIGAVELVESTSRIARDQYRMHPGFLPIYDAVMKMKVRTQ